MAVKLFAYTDGACSGNPGPGGWAAILIAREDGKVLRIRELSGGEALTTNNRMELTAAIAALEALNRSTSIILVTDSNYVRDGITRWLPAWKRNDWQTSVGKPVKNEDLWRQLDAAAARHVVDWRWVRGHAGDPDNEAADALARTAMAPFKM